MLRRTIFYGSKRPKDGSLAAKCGDARFWTHLVAQISAFAQESSRCPTPASDLVEISKLNGDFKRNYGTFVGAYLYSRSLKAVRGRPYFWGDIFGAACCSPRARPC
jgi:hypothetical protein